MHIFKDTHFDFLRWRWHAIILSWVLIIGGVVMYMTKGMPLGIEFAGGTAVIVTFDQPTSVQQVRGALDKSFPGGGENVIVQTFGDPALRQVMVRVPHVGGEQGTELSKTKQQVLDALSKGGVGAFKESGTQIVGPAVGRELRSKALLATVFSLIGILAYLAFRFQFSFGVGAVVATVHDLLITFAFLAFFRYDLSLNVIAALLTITGYSVNDTIVIFDRVRENLRGMRRDNIDHVVNVAVNQTLGRTVLTAGSTLISVLALFFFGGEVLHGFAFTMLVGVVVGTYSSVFIAAAIVIIWQGFTKRPGKLATAPAPGQTPAKARRPARRRAS